MGEVRRVYVEKKKDYAVKAKELHASLKQYLGLDVESVRVLVRYDIENLSDASYEKALVTVFSEPPVDDVYEETLPLADGEISFSVEFLPGQFDQRADSAQQCVKLLNEDEDALIRSATTYVVKGDLTDEQLEAVKEYCINPVDSREAAADKPETLVMDFEEPADVKILDGFKDMEEDKFKELYDSLNLAMTFKDFLHIQNYYKGEEKRDPSMTEIRVLDTYWSDHCRHTTFSTELTSIGFQDGFYRAPLEEAYYSYMDDFEEMYKDRDDKYVCLMDMALMAMKRLKKDGILDNMEESDEINACSIVVPVEIDGKVYGVPTYKDSSLSEFFVWDQDIADKYEIDVEKVTDFESLYTALKTIKEGEGGSPYFMSKNGANFLLNLSYDDLSSGLPAIGVKYDDETMTVVNPLNDEELLSKLDIIHQMYQEGIINGDAPTADDSSKYATFFAAQGWSGAAKTTWGPNNGVENCTAVQYGDTVVSNTTVRGSINGIYSGCEHPDKALELLNLVNTDSKVRDWFYYGAEGVDFEYTEDNKVHRLSTDWKMAGYTQGTFFNVTQTDDVDFNQWDEVKELNENAKPSVMIGFNLDTSEIETELANCRAVYEKYYSELFTGAREPREMVETINEELEKAGWETIREEAQKQIDAQK